MITNATLKEEINNEDVYPKTSLDQVVVEPGETDKILHVSSGGINLITISLSDNVTYYHHSIVGVVNSGFGLIYFNAFITNTSSLVYSSTYNGLVNLLTDMGCTSSQCLLPATGVLVLSETSYRRSIGLYIFGTTIVCVGFNPDSPTASTDFYLLETFSFVTLTDITTAMCKKYTLTYS